MFQGNEKDTRTMSPDDIILLSLLLTLKRRGDQFDPPVVFLKLYFLERGQSLVFFVTLNIIIRHIFTKNFIEIPQVVRKI